MTQPQQPAFPTPEGALKALTKREYFAAIIMAAQYSNPDTGIIAMSPQQAATMAVEGANALIEALNKSV